MLAFFIVIFLFFILLLLVLLLLYCFITEKSGRTFLTVLKQYSVQRLKKRNIECQAFGKEPPAGWMASRGPYRETVGTPLA